MNNSSKHLSDLFNAAKIALSCVISSLIASCLGLKYSMTAGLITVLSIQDTKKETVFTALKRLGAYFAAMIISVCCFRLMGYNIYAFGAYIFIFVIVCLKLQWKSAIVPISVLVTHLLGEHSTDIRLILNEFLIFVIGAGIGILVNLHLRRSRLRMQAKRQLLDDEIRASSRECPEGSLLMTNPTTTLTASTGSARYSFRRKKLLIKTVETRFPLRLMTRNILKCAADSVTFSFRCTKASLQ